MVIYCLMQDLSLCERQFQECDFADRNNLGAWRILSKMHELGMQRVTFKDLTEVREQYFHKRYKPEKDILLEKLNQAEEIDVHNFESYYAMLRKYSILRYYSSIGLLDSISPENWTEDYEYQMVTTIAELSDTEIYERFERKLERARERGIPKLICEPADQYDVQEAKETIVENATKSADGMVNTKTIMLIGGESKAGKSFLAEELAFRVQNGIDWKMYDKNKRLYRVLEVHQRDVLYVDFEMQTDDLAKRLAAIKRVHNLSGEPFDRICVQGTGADFKQVCYEIKRWIRRHENARLVIMDCWYSFFAETGGTDENNAVETANTMKALDEIANMNVCVAYIHHYSKSAKSQRGNSVSAGDKVSGSSVHSRKPALFWTTDVTTKDDKVYVDLNFGGRFSNELWTACFVKQDGVFVPRNDRVGFTQTEQQPLTELEQEKQKAIDAYLVREGYVNLDTIKTRYEVNTKTLRKMGYRVDSSNHRIYPREMETA